MPNILLKTTISYAADDWNIKRFSLLAEYLSSLVNAAGQTLFTVEARDRLEGVDGNDADLKNLANSQFDQLWLFAVDVGAGLTDGDCEGITGFRKRGGGCMLTRDHQDMGACLLKLGQVGAAHHFHSHNCEPNEERHCRDDIYTTSLTWPNYHSGRNGDYQQIMVIAPIHPLLRNPDNPDRVIRYFPAHPHEGAIGVPNGAEEYARVIATGTSKVTGRSFNIAVVFDRSKDDSNQYGRVVAESTFHHFADYNWNPHMGCPSFVTEPEGKGMLTNPKALDDIHAYVRNIALWLSRMDYEI